MRIEQTLEPRQRLEDRRKNGVDGLLIAGQLIVIACIQNPLQRPVWNDDSIRAVIARREHLSKTVGALAFGGLQQELRVQRRDTGAECGMSSQTLDGRIAEPL